MNFKKINFKSPLIILIIILILIAIIFILLNQDKINFSLTNDNSQFNLTFNTENFQDENILNQSNLDLLDEKIKELEKKITPLKNSLYQFDKDINIKKKNYKKNLNHYN